MESRLSLVVPLRRFGDAKSRLATVLTDDERATLARACAESVLSCGLPAFVVCDDPETADFARSAGATPIVVSSRGLNPALAEALPLIRSAAGACHLMFAHADLPFGGDLTELANRPNLDGHDVVIVSDRHKDGSNVVIVGESFLDAWNFRYGPASFVAHHRLAVDLGARVTVVDHPRLSIDLDTPDDLNDPRVASFVARFLGHDITEGRSA